MVWVDVRVVVSAAAAAEMAAVKAMRPVVKRILAVV